MPKQTPIGDSSLMTDPAELKEEESNRGCVDTAQQFTIVSGTASEVDTLSVYQVSEILTRKP